MRTNAMAATLRLLLAYLAAIAPYCWMAAFRSPSTSALCRAALSSTSAAGGACDISRPAPNTAAIVRLNFLRMVKPSIRVTMRISCPAAFIGMSRFGHAFGIEAVPDAAQRDEIARALRPRLDLLPQVVHLVVDHAIGDVRVPPPDLIQQLRPRQHAAGAADEDRKQFVLERGELHGTAVAPQFAAGEVQLRIAETADVGSRGPGAAEVGLD